MKSRSSLVMQAAGAIALAAIVYLFYLAPQGDGPVEGIDVEPPPELAPERNGADPSLDRGDRGGRGSEAIGAEAARNALQPPAFDARVAAEPETPTQSQYSSTIARILNRVGRGGP